MNAFAFTSVFPVMVAKDPICTRPPESTDPVICVPSLVLRPTLTV
jgi:hypothetical protein